MAVWDSDTAIGGREGTFPETRLSAVRALRSGDPARKQAWETIVTLYWKPVYKHLRIKWRKSNEDAKDLTQAFFARAMEKDFFADYDPAKARFRTFLRACVDGFSANSEKASGALKRGGGIQFLALDFHQAEAELALSPQSPDECFDREWIRSVFTSALMKLRQLCSQAGQDLRYELFNLYDVERNSKDKMTYAHLAEKFGISVTDVTNYLSRARKDFRECVLATLREITGSEDEFRAEARRLLRVKLP